MNLKAHSRILFKDTYTENTPQNKTETLKKNININIWIVSSLNQLFTRGSYKTVSEKNFVLFDRPILYSPFYLS